MPAVDDQDRERTRERGDHDRPDRGDKSKKPANPNAKCTSSVLYPNRWLILVEYSEGPLTCALQVLQGRRLHGGCVVPLLAQPPRTWPKGIVRLVREGQLQVRPQVCFGPRPPWSRHIHGQEKQESCPASRSSLWRRRKGEGREGRKARRGSRGQG
jgi:hypothetical protein